MAVLIRSEKRLISDVTEFQRKITHAARSYELMESDTDSDISDIDRRLGKG